MGEAEYQSSWGWLIAADFFLGGTGASLFIISFVLRFYGLYPKLSESGFVIGLIFVVAGFIILAAHLGRRQKFLGAIKGIKTSWISRGAIFTFLFIVFAILYITLSVIRETPWTQGTSVGLAIGIIGSIFAFVVVLYPGFLLLSFSSIPFWNTAILPILFLSYSLIGAIGVLSVVLLTANISFAAYLPILFWQLMLLVSTAILVLIQLIATSSSRTEAQRSLLELTRGKLFGFFIVGTMIIGLIIPLLATAISYFARDIAIAAISGILVLIGALLYRYSLLAAGAYVQLGLYYS